MLWMTGLVLVVIYCPTFPAWSRLAYKNDQMNRLSLQMSSYTLLCFHISTLFRICREDISQDDWKRKSYRYRPAWRDRNIFRWWPWWVDRGGWEENQVENGRENDSNCVNVVSDVLHWSVSPCSRLLENITDMSQVEYWVHKHFLIDQLSTITSQSFMSEAFFIAFQNMP